MRKVLFGLLVFSFIMSTPAFAAPDRAGKWDAGLNVSGVIPNDGDFDDSVYVGGTVSYGVNDWFAVGLESGWASPDVDNAADVDMVPLLVDFIVRQPAQADQPQVFYGVLGLGALFFSADSNIAGVNVDIDDAFGVKLGGGVDWFVNENWALNFEASYIFSDASASASAGPIAASGDVDTDYWQIGGGIKYVFG